MYAYGVGVVAMTSLAFTHYGFYHSRRGSLYTFCVRAYRGLPPSQSVDGELFCALPIPERHHKDLRRFSGSDFQIGKITYSVTVRPPSGAHAEVSVYHPKLILGEHPKGLSYLGSLFEEACLRNMRERGVMHWSTSENPGSERIRQLEHIGVDPFVTHPIGEVISAFEARNRRGGFRLPRKLPEDVKLRK